MATKDGEKTGGRQKGTPNKLTTSVKEALETVYEKLGGHDGFHTWAMGEPTEFYKLYAKMLPKDINASIEAKLSVTMIDEFEASLE